MKWRFRLGAALGNTLEYYDVAVFAAISMYLSAELERLGYSQATEMVWGIFALRFIVRPVGGYVIGRYADRVGKKPALILTSLITGTATLCMALLPIELLGAYTPIVILILQMALSLSFAGEYPSLITYLFASTTHHEQAKVSSIISGSSVLGVILSLSLVFILERVLTPETMQSIGWRIPLLLGVVNIVISFWFRAKLPHQPLVAKEEQAINWLQASHIFLLTIPGTVIFFAQNISASIIIEKIQITDLKNIYGITLSCSLLICMLLCGWLTDKYSSPEKVFNLGVSGMIILSVPLYIAISHHSVIFLILSQTIMTIYAAMILCNFSYMLSQVAQGKVATLAFGFNIAATVLGGITPLVINYLVEINLLFVGVFLAFCGVSRFVVYRLPKLTLN
ncbi:MFS transporter [Providencia manganoxydans]|uniref:MFS transporter n=2 Tax=Providencia manganoxydans TaxID=2923283 RepID=UPI0032DADE17